MSRTLPLKPSVKIGVAAKILGVSIDTLRRWEKKGKLPTVRTPGGTRLYNIKTLQKIIGVPQKPTLVKIKKPAFLSARELIEKTIKEASPLKIETSFHLPFPPIPNLPNLPKFPISSKSLLTMGGASFALACVATGLILLGGSFLRETPKDKEAVTLSNEIAPKDLAAFDAVLPASVLESMLEINTNLQVNGTINGLTIDSVDESSLTVSGGNIALDQTLTTSSSPTFSSLTLSATTDQLTNAGNNFTLPDATTTLVGTDTKQTLTNKTMSGSSNTFTNIPNSALTNNKVTVTAGTNLTGGGAVELGSSVTLSLKTSPVISGILQLADGTAAAPSLTFTDDTNTGLYRIGTDNISLITGGVAAQGITIDASGNIGLATITPTTKLHVVGTANVTGNTTIGGTLGVTGATTLTDDLAVNGGDITTNATTFNLINTTATSINFGGAATSIIAGASGGAFDIRGNLGVGTSSPGARLSVAGGATVGYSGTEAAPTNGLSVFGNLGVGTTSPNYKLEVVGTGRFAETLTASNGLTLSTGALSLTSTSGTANLTLSSSTTAFNVNSQFDIDTTNQRVGIGTTLPTNKLSVLGTLDIFGGNVGIGTSTPGARLSVAGGTLLGYTGTQTAPTNGLAVFGNVGIGTTSPNYKLEVVGDTNITGNLTVGGTTSPNSAILLSNGSNSTPSLSFASDTDTGLYRYGSDHISFVTGGTDRISINSGNVGIGTTSPQTALHVSGVTTVGDKILASTGSVNIGSSAIRFGTGYFDSVDATNLVGTVVGGSTTATDWTINSDNTTGDAEAMSLAFERGSTTPNAVLAWDVAAATATEGKEFDFNSRLHITGTINSLGGLLLEGFGNDITTALNEHLSLMPNGTGNVGIGTTGPGATLQINGNAVIGYGMGTTAGPTNGLAVLGNVGIGTTSPGSTLQLASGQLLLADGSNSAPALSFGSDTNTGLYRIDSDRMSFVTGGASALTINSSGNVGIGNTNPGGSLIVNSGNVGVGTNSPGAHIELVNTNTSLDDIFLTNYGAYADIVARRANGTSSSPTAVTTDQDILVIAGLGHNGSSFSNHLGATIEITAAEQWTSTNQGAYIDFSTTPIGSTTNTTRVRIDPAGNVGIGYAATVQGALAVNGNVGIGTSTPGSALQIVGAGVIGYGVAPFAAPTNGLVVGGNVGVGSSSPIAKLHVEGQCVTGDTKLKRRRRRKGKNGKWIEDWEDVRIDEIEPGDEILTLDEETGKFVLSVVEGLMDMGVQEVFSLITQSGLRIETTANHPYLTTNFTKKIEKGGVFEVDQSNRIEELNKDTFISVANKDMEIPLKVSKKLKIALYNFYNETHSKEKKLKIFAPLTFARSIVAILQSAHITPAILVIDTEYPGYEAIIIEAIRQYDKTISIFFKSIGKKSPAHLMAYGFGSKNARFKRQQKMIAIPFEGTIALLHPEFTGIRNARNHFLATEYHVQVNLSRDKNRWVKVSQLKPGMIIATLNGWEKIRTIYSTGKKQTYDIQVANTHNFVGNGIVAHNTYISGNLGVGTSSPGARLSVAGGGLFGYSGTQSLSSGSDLAVLGNVGIGTTSPAYNLQVVGTTNITGASTFGGALQLADGTNAAPSLTFTNDTNTGLYRIDSDRMSFVTGGASALTINSSGNVGIGTTAPTSLLSVAGAAAIGSGYASGSPTAPSNGLIVQGNVGIGTSTPGSALQIVGAGVIGYGVAPFAAPTNGLVVGGNVGVGSSSPIAKLHVEGQCVTGDTKLRRRRRRRRRNQESGIMEDYWEDIEIKDIQEGDEILTMDESTGQLVVSKVKALLDMGKKGIFKLTTASGKQIRTTGNHPYFVKTTKEIKPKVGIFIDDSNIFFAAKKLGWKVNINRLVKLLKHNFAVEFANYYVAIPHHSDKAYAGTTNYLTKLSKDINIVRKPLKYIIDEETKKPAKKGNVDIEIAIDVARTIEDIDLAIIVSGDSDFVELARFAEEKGKQIAFIGYKHNMAWELRLMQHLFLEKIETEVKLGAKKNPAISGATKLGLLYQDIANLSSGGKWKKVTQIEKGAHIAVAGRFGKAVWDKVVKIEKLKEEQVYDIEVENTHNFVGNGIVAHNTYISGNLGVGTSSPGSKLSIAGGSTIGYTGTQAAPSNGLAVLGNVGIGTTSPAGTLQLASGQLLLADGSNSAPALSFGSDTNTGLYRIDSDRMSFVTGGASRATIDSSGNLGIGTTGPTSLLSVAGAATIGSGYASGSPTAPSNGLIVQGNVGIGTSTPGSTLQIAGNQVIGYGVAPFTAPSQGLVVSGNTGIGTSSPTNKLSILGTADIFGGNLGIGTSSPGARLAVAGGGLFGYSGTQSLSSGADLAVLGNVGIGTTSPSSELHVIGAGLFQTNLTVGGNTAVSETLANSGFSLNGDDLFVSGSAGIEGNVYTDGSFIAGASTTYGNGSITQSSGETLTIGVTSADLTLQTTTAGDIVLSPSGGNVGIGTSTPGTTLQVAGNAMIGFGLAPAVSSATNGLVVGGNVGVGTSSPVAKLHVEGQCVTGDTKLRRRRRRKSKVKGQNSKLENDWIWEDVRIDEINPGDEILTLDEETGKFVVQKVEKLMDMGIQDVFELFTQSKLRIRTTNNHPYLVLKNARLPKLPRYTIFEADPSIRIDDLAKDTFFAIANRESSFSVRLSREEKQILAKHYRKMGRPKLFGPEMYSRLIVETIKKFNITVTTLIIDREYSANYDKVIAEIIERDLPQVTLHFGSVGKQSPAHVAANIARKGILTKKVEGQARSNLQGFRAAELLHPEFTGIRSPLSLLTKKDYTTEWVKVKYLKPGMTIATINGWEKISNIIHRGKQPTYDIQVANTHNFVGNGIVAHNTYISGNLGVGTSSPGAKLSVAGGGLFGYSGTQALSSGTDLAVLGNVGIGTTSPGSTLQLASGQLLLADGSNSAPSLSFGSDTNTGLYRIDSDRISFVTGGASALTINSSGNVGIGTTAPTSLLSVAGAAAIGSGYAVGSPTAPSNGLIVQGNVGIGTSTPGSALQIVGAGVIGYGVAPFTAPSQGLVVSGNTGIGTSSPTNKLSVLGTADIFGGNLGVGTSSPGARLAVAGGGLFGYSGTQAAPSNGLAVLGNVGIGTTSPSSELHVIGAGLFQTNLTVGGNTAVSETLANSGFAVNGDDLFVSGSAGIEGNVYTDGSFIAGASTTYGNGSITQSSGETLTIGVTSADLTLQTTTAGDIVLSPSGGNVGIGTSTPGTTLQVAGNAMIGFGLAPAVSSASNGLVVGGNMGIGTSSPTNKLSVVGGNFDLFGGNLGIGTSSPGARLSVAGGGLFGYTGTQAAPTNGLAVLGNVGIGTTSPGSTLQLASGQLLLADGSNSAPALSFGSDTNTGLYRIDSDRMSFVTGGASRLTINSSGNIGIGNTNPGGSLIVNSGNVGIGTNSPVVALHIRGAGVGATLIIEDTSDSPTLQLADSSGGVRTNIHIGDGAAGEDEDSTYFNADTGERHYFTVNGTNLVNLGTKDALNGTLSINDPDATNTNTSFAAIRFTSTPGTDYRLGKYNTGTSTSLQLRNDSNTVLWAVDSNGNVGIGTSTPGSALQIVGAGVIGYGVAPFAAPTNGLVVGGNVGVGSSSPIAKLHVEGQCVTGDTKLRRRRRKKLDDGNEKLDDEDGNWIWEDIEIKDIQEGDEILTLDEETGKFVLSVVEGLMDMGTKDIVKITTVSGKTIRTTANHPYLALTDEKQAFAFIDEVGVGKAPDQPIFGVAAFYINDSLTLNRKLHDIFTGAVSAYNMKKSRFEFKFNSVTKDNLRFFKAIVKALAEDDNWSFTAFLTEKNKSWNYWNSYVTILPRLLARAPFAKLTIVADYLAKPKAQRRELNTIMAQDNVAGLLQLESQGSLHLQVTDILLGALHFEERQKKLGLTSGKEAKIQLARLVKTLLAKKITAIECLHAVEDNISHILPAVKRRQKWIKVKELHEGTLIATFDGWERIKKIEHLPEEQVYDIEVENTHNFVAGHYINKKTGKALTEKQEAAYYEYLHQKTASKAALVNLKGMLNDQTDNLKGNIQQNNDFVNSQKGIDSPGVEPGRLRLSVWSSKPAEPMPQSLSQILGIDVNENDIEYGGIVAHNTYISGNLGVGTSSPGAKLAVAGGGLIGYSGTQAAPTNGLAVLGNVGIGTTSPSSELHVIGAGLFQTNLTVGGNTAVSETLANSGFAVNGDDLFVSGTAGIEGNVYTDGSFIAGASTTYGNGSITQSSGETLTIGVTSADLTLQTTTAGDIVLSPSGGNVGIGTSTPGTTLQVAGNAMIGFGLAPAVSSATNGLVVGGNVGIGVSNPSAKLEVLGNLLFTSGATRTISVADQGSSNTAGNQLSITGAAGNGTGAGGALALTSGAAGTTGDAGLITIQGGLGGSGSGSDGGSISILGGRQDTNVSSNIGGTITISGGPTAGGGNSGGGPVTINGGDTTAGANGGAVTVRGGDASVSGSGNGGGLTLRGGNAGPTNSTGGVASLTGGAGAGTGAGAAVNIAGGAGGSTGVGGAISLTSGAGGTTSGASGALTLATGTTTSGRSGDLNLRSGAATGGNAGDIFFQTNGTNLRMTVAYGGNVGIGTSTPGSTLQIAGNQVIGFGVAPFAAPSQGLVVSGNTGIGTSSPTNKLSILGTADIFGGNLGVGTSSPGARLAVAGGGLFGYSGTQAAPTNGLAVLGNVGIGTTSPGSTLQLASGQLLLADGSNSAPALSFGSDTDTGLYRIDSDRMSFVTGGLSRLTIDSAGNLGVGTTGPIQRFQINNTEATAFVVTSGGNVGIGTTSPLSLLSIGVAPSALQEAEVVGLYQNGNAIYLASQATTDTGGGAFKLAKSRGTHASPTTVVAGDALGSLMWQGYNNAWRNNIAYIEVDAATGWGATGTDTPTLMRFFTTPDGSSTAAERMRIDSAGNVGIGTSTPGTTLQVAGNGMIGFGLAPAVSSATNGLVVGGNLGVGTSSPTNKLSVVGGNFDLFGGNLGIGTSSPGARLAVAGGTILGYAGTQSLSSGTDLAVLGNVGIGTTSPGSTLQLASGQLLLADGSNSAPALSFGSDTNTGLYRIDSDRMSFVTGGLSALTINSSGNVGVGLTGPTQKFQVNNTESTAFVVTSGGNVGIGTTSPTYSLDIAGNFHLKPITQASGGTITYIGGYTVHTFTSNGTFTANVARNVEVLVVAGGGGGGGGYTFGRGAGGGGAGGYQYNSSFAVSAGAITVTVGAGGTKGSAGAAGSDGSNSVFSTITSTGGGGGGGAANGSGRNGGSGGGGANDGTVSAPGTGTAGQGNNGGDGSGPGGGNGGTGGGSTGVGVTATDSSAQLGGTGTSNSISGITTTYATGGPTRAADSLTGVNGTANSGDGGGAGSTGDGSSNFDGGNGGSGIVIVRYLTYAVAIDSTNPFVITSTGNVGIGTSDPSARLQVNANSSNPFVVTSGGNVGIGTTTPGSTLQVAGNGLFGYGAAPFAAPTSGLAVGGNVGIGTSTPGAALQVAGNGLFGYGQASTIAPSSGLAVSGNLGVGTTSPNYKLEVIGSINVTGDVYKNGTAYNNPDYAFEHWATGDIVANANKPGAASYTGILSLEDTEAYALQNFQLPRVASASGMFERGDILLEKVEEAYIHMFELNHKIASLSAALTTQQINLGAFNIASSSAGLTFSSSGQNLLSLDTSGNMKLAGTITSQASGFDVAEEYPVSDESIEAGDVVSIDNQKTASYEAALSGSEMVGQTWLSTTDTVTQPTNNVNSQNGSGPEGNRTPGTLVDSQIPNHSGPTPNTNIPYIEKSSTPYDNTVIGIVSTKPGVNLTGEKSGRPVALAGRVPVKVTTENGAIKAGDSLTSSSIPGYAMKATRAGFVVAKALENFSCDHTPGVDQDTPGVETVCQGKIMAFVNVSWSDPTIVFTANGILPITNTTNSTNIASQSATASSSATQNYTLDANNYTLSKDPLFKDLLSRFDMLSSKLDALQGVVIGSESAELIPASSSANLLAAIADVPLYASGSATLTGDLTVSGRTTLNDVGITGTITSGLLAIDGFEGSLNTLAGDLKLQNLGLGGIDILAGKIRIDISGNLVSEATITAKEVETEKVTTQKLVITEPVASSSAVLSASSSAIPATSANFVIIKAGQTSIEVKTTALTGKSLVFVTPDKPVATSGKVKDSTTITISIPTPTPEDVKVNWWIIN